MKPYPRERLLTSRDIIFIKEMINGGPLDDGSQLIGRSDPSFEFLYDIVSNRHSGLDVDKIDYFARDQRQCHKGSGEVEHLLIEDAFVAWGHCPRPGKCFKCRNNYEGKMHLMICYPEKMVHKALEFFKTRFRLHSEIYTHRTAKGAEFMVCDILKLADPFFRLRAGPDYPDGLPISRAMLDSTAYSLLNDSILDMIGSSPDPRLLPAQRLIDRYERRDFYKYVAAKEISHDPKDATNLLWERTEEEIKSDLCGMKIKADLVFHTGDSGEKIVLRPSDIIVEKMEIHRGRRAHNPVDMMRFLPKGKLSQLSRPIDELPVAEQQPEEIYYSSIPKAFNERCLRVFSRNSDQTHFDLLLHAFEQWCESVMADPNAPNTMNDEEGGFFGMDGGEIANISQDDRTPPRRSVLNHNMKQVSVDHNSEEAESPKPPPRGPTSLFKDGEKK